MKNIYGTTKKCLRAFLEKLYISTVAPKAEVKKYYVSICTIFKDEAPFMKEWVEYHRMIGFDHIYLYNNNSSDNYLEILRTYIDDGFVTLTDWPDTPGQLSAYRHFACNFWNETSWVAFCDLDEFYCPRKCRNIKDFLELYKRYPSIFCYWRLFGAGGKEHHDFSRPVIEQYVNASSIFDRVGKCIVNTDYEIYSYSASSIHFTKVTRNILKHPFVFDPIDIFGNVINSETATDKLLRRRGRKMSESAPIQINHYRNMAWDIVRKKASMTNVFYDENNTRKHFCFFLHAENLIDSVDYSIYRFLTELKLNLKGRMSDIIN
ncbi:MAG: glycosyltransferase family 92 protein [Bacteroidales bacterium]|nr:glycosyltransferase family 92 protein [Bacteroidales bacterium]